MGYFIQRQDGDGRHNEASVAFERLHNTVVEWLLFIGILVVYLALGLCVDHFMIEGKIPGYTRDLGTVADP